MEIISLGIPDVKLIKPRVFNDDRGYFFESYNDADFRKEINCGDFVQDNESFSTYGTLRGLHFQNPPFAQSKLVRVILGKVLDVAVDIRKQSPYFGKYISVILDSELKHQLFIPRGFAHGFVVLSNTAIFSYKVDNIYHKDSEGSICYNDSILNIDWMLLSSDIMLSLKDKKAPNFEPNNLVF